MTFRTILTSSAAALAIGLATSASAVTVHTSSFITGVTNFNGFEGMVATTDFTGPYTEDGITVEYIGAPNTAIWTTSQTGAAGTEGDYSWYPLGGSTGYTRITLASNASFTAIQFQAGSGWFGGGANLQYELLLNGSSVASGSAGALGAYQGMTTFGFDGGTFDEVRLQGALSSTLFNPNAYEAGAYDAIQISGGSIAVPEPATWALMIGGFGLAGATLRRRRAVAA